VAAYTIGVYWVFRGKVDSCSKAVEDVSHEFE